MAKKPKPVRQGGALIPRSDDYPETRKMTETFDANMAIYDFVKHLVDSGYVLARKQGDGLAVMEPWKTSEHEILRFRGIDRLAYLKETTKLRSMYPHLIQTYGVSTEYELPLPEVSHRYGPTEYVPAPDEPVEAADALAFLLGKIRPKDE